MSPLAKQIISAGCRDRVLTDRQIARLVGGSDANRYRLVNRALKARDLLRVKRGLYVLANPLRNEPLHPFVLAQQVMPGSYVSGESALSFHGWIPEAVRSVLSVTATGKSVTYRHEFLGTLEFRRMTVRPGCLLEKVSRQVMNSQVALIASPLRALMDLVYLRKIPWQGLSFLLDGLRVDAGALSRTTSADLDAMVRIYKGKREREFIQELRRALGLYD